MRKASTHTIQYSIPVLLGCRYPFWGHNVQVSHRLLLTLALVSAASLYGDSISINGPLTQNGSIRIYDQYGDLYGEVWANINLIPAMEGYGGSTGVTGEAETYLTDIFDLDHKHLGQPNPMPIPSGPLINFTVTVDVPASYAYIDVDTYVLATDDDCHSGCQPELQIPTLSGAAGQSCINSVYGAGTEFEDIPTPANSSFHRSLAPSLLMLPTRSISLWFIRMPGIPRPKPRTSWELTLAGLLGVFARLRTVCLGKKAKP